jgi:hypothetical protein
MAIATDRPRTPGVHKVTPVQVQAARLRPITDRKLGKQSPPWVYKVANATRG